MAGGETVHFWEDEESWENLYEEPANGRKISDIVFDWLTLEKPFKACFSVGVHPNMLYHQDLTLQLLKKLDYLAVRGEMSKKILEGGIISNDNYIRIVPDIGWLFPKYIENAVPDIPLPSKPYMVFEMFYESDEETILYAADTLKNFRQKTGVEVVLLPIVQTKSKQKDSSWNDYKALLKIYQLSRGNYA